MTTWLPDLSRDNGPLYLELANRIQQDIESGSLPAGVKLPPQRNLAFDIGVTVGTVSRAYAVVRERGLVTGEVGRGTFVASRETGVPNGQLPITLRPPGGYHEEARADVIRLDSSAAFSEAGAAEIRPLLAELSRDGCDEMAGYVRGIEPDWRKAGAEWIALGSRWRPDEENVLPTSGAQGALISIIAGATNPGDRIACETLTFAGVPRSAQLIGRGAVSVAIDEKGILPESFETVCAQQHPRLLFLMPAVHTPLTVALSPERRRAIIEIARRYNVLIIEDHLYASVTPDPYEPIAALAPDITFHIGGLSKAVAAGLRAGWVATPAHMTARVWSAQKMLTGGSSYLLSDMAARMVNSGAAMDVRTRVREEIARRVTVMRTVFEGCDIKIRDYTPFAWLKLPEPWLSGTFKAAAYEEKVRIDDEDEFKAGRGDQRFHGVRVAFAAMAKDIETMEIGARRLRRLLDAGPAAYHSYN